MSLRSYLNRRLLGLDAPTASHVVVQRDLRVPMPDGVELLADRWAPKPARQPGQGPAEPLPTVLIRSPYGRRGLIGWGMARPFAERGCQVLMQSTRGTFGSGGEFDPMRRERDDGLATLEWLRKQPWVGGSIGLVGASYIGYVQWAVADQLPPEVKAMIPLMTESALTLEFLREDGLSLETPFGWGAMIANQDRPLGMLRGLVQAGRIRQALDTVPLGKADVAAIGRRSDYIQDVIACAADDPRWAGIDHRHRVAGVQVPVSSIGGWYDIFLPGQLRDFRVLQQAGNPARLMVGPVTHLSPDRAPPRGALRFGRAPGRGALTLTGHLYSPAPVVNPLTSHTYSAIWDCAGQSMVAPRDRSGPCPSHNAAGLDREAGRIWPGFLGGYAAGQDGGAEPRHQLRSRSISSAASAASATSKTALANPAAPLIYCSLCESLRLGHMIPLLLSRRTSAADRFA